MKKTILTLTVIFITSFYASAQLSQGHFLVGGGLSADFGNDKMTTKSNNVSTTVSTSYTDINFTPKVGYFFADNAVLGLGMNIGSQSSAGKNDHTNIGIGPLFRYYLPMKLFGEAYLGYRHQRDNDSDAENYNGIDYSLGGGFAWFINKNVAFEPTIKYAGYSVKNSQYNYKHSHGGLVIGLGFQIYL